MSVRTTPPHLSGRRSALRSRSASTVMCAWWAQASPAAPPRCTWRLRACACAARRAPRRLGRLGAQWRAGDLRNRRGPDQTRAADRREAARAVWDVSVEGLALMRELIARFSIDCDWARGTWPPPSRSATSVSCTRSSRDCTTARLRERALHAARRAACNARDRALPRRPVRHEQRSSAPPQLHAGTRGGGRGLGVRIFEQPAPRVSHPRALAGSHPDSAGEVRARHLALCGNVYLGATAPTLASKIMAVATYIVATNRWVRSARDS